MAKHFGSDADAASLAWQFRWIRAGAKIQQNAVANGSDPKDFNVDVNAKGQRRARDGHRGKDFKKNARRQREAYKAGIDPQTLNIATAEKYGDGTTGKAISTRFERMRKEPSWDLSTPPANTNKVLGTPKKRAPRTPSKKSAKKTAASSEEANEDDDSDIEMVTPSKKGSLIKKEALNKVKGGRVEKKPNTPGRAAKNGIKNYNESDDEGEDDEVTIKDEYMGGLDFGRAAEGDEDLLGGGGFTMGNGHGNGGDSDEDQFYDDES
ncbi:hypothetical protein NHQ30_003657 [Ciborinia camelliae]|nr:hypothetical protein NHQ30_003657 [Ciborinia camelliae]